jgi:type I restriction enzyme S subunit
VTASAFHDPWCAPANWARKRFKYFGSFLGGGTPAKDRPEYWNGAIPWVSPKDMKASTIQDTEDHISLAAVAGSATRLVPPGALLMVVRSGILRHSVPTALNAVEVALNQDMRAFRSAADCSPRFVHYLVEGHQQLLLTMWRREGATVESLEAQLVENTMLALPDMRTQETIVAFLDRKTIAIDQLIRKKERLIELLHEKRLALITRAVTKGLDPNVPMKGSGADYIGPIPSHWRTLRIALASEKLCNGYVGPTRDILVDEGVPYLQSLHIKDGEVRFEKPYFVTSQWLRQHQRVQLRTDDVVIVQTGDIGQVAVISEEWDGAGCHALIIFRPRSKVGLGRFFAWFFRSTPGRELLLREQTGALHPHLEVGKVREIPVPVPPVGEQREIARRLALIDGELGQQGAAVAKQVVLLREYRQAIISAAVTGRIRIGAGEPHHG